MARTFAFVCLAFLVWPASGHAQKGSPAAAAAPGPAFPLEAMATCKDSWLEWGANDARVSPYRESFRAQFTQKDGEHFFVPIGKVSVMGLPVERVYANTVGMGVGFSLSVDAPFDRTKAAVEKSLGKSLTKCETGEGMRTCELSIAEKRTVMLLGDSTGKVKSTLVGCFYYYEK